MTGIVISQTFDAPFTVRLGWMFGAVDGDAQDHRLANLVIIALNTDRRALPDDVLPDRNSDDRRGWWGDTDGPQIWGGWPIGTRLWLLQRAKLTDSNAREGATIERARRYIREALDPIVSAKIATRYTLDLQQGQDKISGSITIFRGPKSAISLRFADLWTDFGGAPSAPLSSTSRPTPSVSPAGTLTTDLSIQGDFLTI